MAKEKKKVEEQPIEETKEEKVEKTKEEPKVEEKKKPKKAVVVLLAVSVGLILFGIGGIVIFNFIIGGSEPKIVPAELEPLPKPEVDPDRGIFGVDKNINIDTIDEYLGRKDTVYRDMRMLEDPATYENIGGDRFLSGYIDGFEVFPLPYIIPVDGLPVEVGQTYDGITLFYEQDGKYIANYEESMELLEKYFPKDKNIFLMCGGGGYASMMKNFLIAMGWDENKLYNIGGYWYYEGKNKVDIRRDNGSYDFDKVPYINIDFNNLTKADTYKDAGVKVTSVYIGVDKIEVEEKLSYVLYSYVQPNLASNKEVVWSSSNDKVATVSENGTVKGVKEGNAAITVTTRDGGFTASCEVVVKKRIENKMELDDISKESSEFSAIDIAAISKKYNDILYDEDGYTKEYYKNIDNYNVVAKQRDEEFRTAFKERAAIINKLFDEKKSFIIISYNDSCGSSPYNVSDNAPVLFDKLGISYINNKENYYTSNSENLYSFVDGIDYGYSNNSVLIIKEGKLISYLNIDATYINDEEDFKIWMSKYIDIK